MGELVSVKTIDSVRIEVLGESRAVTIPASLIIELDDSLKIVRESGHALLVYKMGGQSWLAACGHRFVGAGCSPLQAIANMKIRKD